MSTLKLMTPPSRETATLPNFVGRKLSANRFFASSRSSALRILPNSVIGKASMNTTWRGSLKLATLPRQWPSTSSASITAPSLRWT